MDVLQVRSCSSRFFLLLLNAGIHVVNLFERPGQFECQTALGFAVYLAKARNNTNLPCINRADAHKQQHDYHNQANY
jgi:hypothetical protein